MLIIARQIRDLDFSQLMDVYRQDNLKNGRSLWETEQNFYEFLSQIFFQTPGAVYAVWAVEGRYVSALRLEPFQDGMLVEALETAPGHRRRGCGTDLMNAVIAWLAGEREHLLYSHVSKRNRPSLALHSKCGFVRVLDHAVYIDGTVLQSAVTMVRSI